MDRKKRNVLWLISAFVLLGGLVAMIAVTASFSSVKGKDWSYYEQTESIDYYSTDADVDFQYVANFRHAIMTYFGSLINDKIAQYIDVESQMEAYFGTFADKLVSAASKARISAAKLNQVADCLKSNSVGSVFSSIPEFLKNLNSLEELEEGLEAYLNEHSPVVVLGRLFRSVMDETALTEAEIAGMLYFYLSDNASEEYVSYLTLLGKEFFTELVADSLYALSTVEKIGYSAYQTKATAYSAQAVLYQLGSLYVRISSLTGNVETLERVFHLTWEYDPERYEKAEEWNALSASIRGKIGKLFVFVGYVLRALSAEDVEAYLTYHTDRKKEDEKIYAAIRLSKAVDEAFVAAQSDPIFTEVDLMSLCECFAGMSAGLRALSDAILSSVEEEEEQGEEIVGKDAFSLFAASQKALVKTDASMDEIRSMDKESEEYRLLNRQADDVFGVSDGFSALIGNVVMIWIGNAITEKGE